MEGINDPDDEGLLKAAIESIGDFKLKSAPEYKVPKHLRISTVRKFKELLDTREKVYLTDVQMSVFDFSVSAILHAKDLQSNGTPSKR